MQEYKLIDKFDGYKLLDRNGQVIYVQTDDVKKQLSLGNVRIYGLKLSESGRLFKETPEEIKEQQRQQQEQIKQQQLLEKQRQEQIRAEQQRQQEERRRQEEEQARQLKANLQWKGTLFGVPLDEFKAEFGGRSYGDYPDRRLRTLFDIWFDKAYDDDMMYTKCMIHNHGTYRSGIIQAYDSEKNKYIETEYYIALANRLWATNLSQPVNKRCSRDVIVKQVELMGTQDDTKFKLRKNNEDQKQAETLFGVPLTEFKAEFGGRSHGIDYEDLLLTEIKYGIPYEDQTMFNATCKINSYDEYKNGLIWVYDPDRKQFIQTEYFIALANKMWHNNLLRKNKKSRESVVNRVEQIGEIAGQFRLDLRWKGTLFGVPLDEFKAEFGGRSYGPYGTDSLMCITNAAYGVAYRDNDIRANAIIDSHDKYESGIIRVFDDKQGRYIETEYYIALANSLYSRYNNNKSERQVVVDMVNKIGSRRRRMFGLRQDNEY